MENTALSAVKNELQTLNPFPTQFWDRPSTSVSPGSEYQSITHTVLAQRPPAGVTHRASTEHTHGAATFRTDHDDPPGAVFLLCSDTGGSQAPKKPLNGPRGNGK